MEVNKTPKHENDLVIVGIVKCAGYKKGQYLTTKKVMKKYPNIVAHIICESLGYATPTKAALILKDAIENKENWCEWIYSCYNKQPMKAVQQSIQRRHNHKGYMAEIKNAKYLVKKALEEGKEPEFASWF